MLNTGRLCPGAVKLEDETPDHPDTEWTAIGKAGHKWLELMLSEGKEAAVEYIKTAPVPDDFHLTLVEFWTWLEHADLFPLDADSYLTEQTVKWAEGDFEGTGTADLIVVKGDEAWVVDWKFYNDPSDLTPIHEDLQMYAYAVGGAKMAKASKVTVHRVLCYFNFADTLELDAESLKLAEEALLEEAAKMARGCDDFNVGAQCERCFQQSECKVWLAQAGNIDTTAMAPYTGGELTTEADVLRFLLAVPVIEHLIKEGKEQAKFWIEQNNTIIVDHTSNQWWGPKEAKRDQIVDVTGCLGELIRRTSQDAGLSAAKTSKSAMDKVLKAAGVKPKERKAFVDVLRERGCIVKKELAPRYEWRKLKA
jgi:hypothetical protein